MRNPWSLIQFKETAAPPTTFSCLECAFCCRLCSHVWCHFRRNFIMLQIQKVTFAVYLWNRARVHGTTCMTSKYMANLLCWKLFCSCVSNCFLDITVLLNWCSLLARSGTDLSFFDALGVTTRSNPHKSEWNGVNKWHWNTHGVFVVESAGWNGLVIKTANLYLYSFRDDPVLCCILLLQKQNLPSAWWLHWQSCYKRLYWRFSLLLK